MASCELLGDALSAYLDGELGPAEHRSVAEHLSICPACAAELEGLKQVKRFLAVGSPLAAPLPKDLAARVRQSAYPRPLNYIAPIRRPRFQMPRFAIAGPALTALLVVIALLAGVFGPGLLMPSPVAATAKASLSDHVYCARLGRVVQSLPGDVDEVSSTLSQVLGMSIAVPRGLPDGFRFVGGRSIRAGNLPAAHLAWLEDESLLSFYQAADPGGDPPADWRKVDLGGRGFWLAPDGREHAVLWREGGIIYIMAGNLSEDRLLQVVLAGDPPP